MSNAMKSNPSQTLLVICTGLVLVYFIINIQWILYVSFGLGLLAVLSDWFSKKVELIWFKFTYLLSLIVPNILLGLVFYLILTPVAFLATIFKKKDALLLKKPEKSAYQTIKKTYQPVDLENPW